MNRCIKKLTSMLLALIISMSMITAVPITANAASNPYPATQNIDGDAYYEIPCTRLAWQQVYDNLGVALPAWGNAVTWWQSAINAGYATGSEPRPGSVAVWSGDYYGHVAYVVSGSGSTMYLNEGGRTDLDHTSSHGVAYNYKLTNAVGAPRPYDTGKTLLGFIYPTGVADSDVDLGTDFYGMIINQPSGKSIGQADSGNVEVIYEAPSTYDRIIWHFTRNADKTYTIKSVLNGKCLDVANASSAENTNVQCCDANGSSAQQWHIASYINGSYYLRANCTTHVLDLLDASYAEGTNVQTHRKNSSTAQQFSIYKITSDFPLDYTIKSDKDKYEADENVTVTVGGVLNYAYNYKFHIINPDGTESVVDNKCNSVLNFDPTAEGKYTVYAEVKNPCYTDKGTVESKSVTFTVGCDHKYTEEFIESDGESQGYILHTCSVCGNSFKDSFMDYEDGWYYAEQLPSLITSGNYTVECNNIFEKVQKDSPGDDWTMGEVVQNEWVNSGDPYTTYIQQETSDSRVLVQEYYYHWCMPGGATGSAGNYISGGNYVHYDQISLPNNSIYVTGSGVDEGHPYYTLAWSDGSAVYCQSGVTCDGSFGSHGARCRAWYKNYVYQDRVKVELYKYTKESGWTTDVDPTATKTVYKFKPDAKYLLGDTNLDGFVSVDDVTYLQMHLARYTDKDGNALIDETNKNILAAADVEKDGELTVGDVTALQMTLAGYTL